MKIILCFLFLFGYKLIYCNKTSCYEYSCEECESEEYRNCTKCKDTFLLVDGTCPCEDFGCALCTFGLVGSYCKLCKDGYILKGNYCECKQENCEVCGKDKCIKCNRGFYYNEILKKCVKKDCLIANCEYCDYGNEGQEICHKCQDGFFFDNGNCTELTTQNIELEQCDKQDKYESYTYCDVGCTEYECNIPTQRSYQKKCHSGKCLICIYDILYIHSNCTAKDECSIEGCNTCLAKNECARCDRGYRIYLGQCIKCIKGCSLCSNNYTCDYCLSGYELNNKRECVFTNIFDFDTNEYKRQKKILNKDIQEEDSTSVIDTTVVTEEIFQTIKNCVNYVKSGECLKCKNNYYLYNNECFKCSSSLCKRCEMINNEEICIECIDYYYPYPNNNDEMCSKRPCNVETCDKCHPLNDISV